MRVLSRRTLIRLALAAVLAVPGAAAAQANANAQAGPTTVVIVRHAEKATDDPRDPTLSAEGQARAAALAAALEKAGVSAVYATHYRRTQLTGQPTAAAAGVQVTVRRIASSQAYAADLVRETLAAHAGKTVLVVGHSNTVPDLVRAFSGQTIAPLTEAEYDHLFVVQVPASGPARLLRARYGVPTAPSPAAAAPTR